MKRPPDGWDADEQDLPDDLAEELSTLGGERPPLPLDVLRAAGADVLPETLERTAQEYLSKEPRARALVAALNDTPALDAHAEARLYARISREMPAAAPRRSRWVQSWQVAAAMTAIAVAGAWWLWMARDRTEAPAVVATQTPEQPRANTAPAAASKPETFLLPLERPDVRISLRALTWRGSERANPILAALKPSLDAFRAGDYRRADAEFAAVNKTYPNLVEVLLYQGVSRLFLDDIPGAAASLAAAEKLQDDSFANDVQWYLAVAEERGGNIAGARARLAKLCPAGAGDPRACSILAKP